MSVCTFAQDATTRTTTTEVTTTGDLTTAPAAGPAIRWREFRGQVTHVNVERQMLELKLKGTGEYIGVPILPSTVGIYKDDHQYTLSDIKNGDNITVRNLALNF